MQNRNTCANCKYFQRYYAKGINQFTATDLGHCNVLKRIIAAQETCNRFLQKPYQCKNHKTLQKSLHEILIHLSAIRVIIEEQEHEKDENTEL